MSDLLKALQIFYKYVNLEYPTYCKSGYLFVDIDPAIVSVEDKTKLNDLGFYPSDTDELAYISTRFGG